MVKRYDPVVHPMDNGGMEEYNDGSFVKYEDYLSMKNERDSFANKNLHPTQDEVNDLISRFVNGTPVYRSKLLGVAMAKDHRTLVQAKMQIVMNFLTELANMYVCDQYDDRNAQSCRVAYKMLGSLEDTDHYMPFI